MFRKAPTNMIKKTKLPVHIAFWGGLTTLDPGFKKHTSCGSLLLSEGKPNPAIEEISHVDGFHEWDWNYGLIQKSYTVNMQLYFLDDICHCQQKCIIWDPRSISPDLACQPQPQTPHRNMYEWWGQENVKRFSDRGVLTILSLPPDLK